MVVVGGSGGGCGLHQHHYHYFIPVVIWLCDYVVLWLFRWKWLFELSQKFSLDHSFTVHQEEDEAGVIHTFTQVRKPWPSR